MECFALHFYVFRFAQFCHPHVLPLHRIKFIFYNTQTSILFRNRSKETKTLSKQYTVSIKNKQTKAFKSLERVRLVEGENEWEMQIKTNEKLKKYNSNVISLFFCKENAIAK